jgi:hypothetical protein
MIAYVNGNVFVQMWVGVEDKLPRMVRARGPHYEKKKPSYPGSAWVRPARQAPPAAAHLVFPGRARIQEENGLSVTGD